MRQTLLHCSCHWAAWQLRNPECACTGNPRALPRDTPVDVLRTHDSQAQARANHIVDEFESMLLVTGGHSMKDIKHMQTQAGLGSHSPPAARARSKVSLHLGAHVCRAAFVPFISCSISRYIQSYARSWYVCDAHELCSSCVLSFS